MPSNSNTDKQNDKLEKATEADKKFIAFKKRMFWLGIGFLIAAIVLSLLNYFFLETSNNIVGAGIFLFVVLADIFILLPAIITKETNWLALLGSTILCIVFLCLSVFYPFQDVQYRLKVISLVAIVATILFVALNSWINAAFFPSKNANIRQSVDFASNRFAVDVLNVTLILGTLFGTIAFLYFYPDKDNSTFFGGIDIKNVALATAGLVTFFWAAKATKNKSIELEEKKQDGKRHDNEIAMAKRRDTAQLITEASKLLSSENDAQKYAGLSFLNAVASDPEGSLRKEAFDLIVDFILTASDVTIANKARMRAIYYADDLVGNNRGNFEINEFIYISSSDVKNSYLESIEIKNLYAVYTEFSISPNVLLYGIQQKNESKIAFIKCIVEVGGIFYSNEKETLVKVPKTVLINNVSVWNCKITNCKIGRVNLSNVIRVEESSTNKISWLNYVPDEYRSIASTQVSKFSLCDFSDCPSWLEAFFLAISLGQKKCFTNCYYYSGHEPEGFDKEKQGDSLIEITSKEQFEEMFGRFSFMKYAPPGKNKRKQSRARKNK